MVRLAKEPSKRELDAVKLYNLAGNITIPQAIKNNNKPKSRYKGKNNNNRQVNNKI